LPHDLLDRDPLASERQDGGIFFLATKPTGMLAAFGATQQRRINDTYAHGSQDRSHRPLHGGEERGAGVLHQVPSVRDLDGFRATLGGSLDVTYATIARDDADRGMLGKPSGDCYCLATGQQIDDATLFQIADDRAVVVAALPGPSSMPTTRGGPCHVNFQRAP